MTGEPVQHDIDTDDGGGVLPQRFRFPGRQGSLLILVLSVIAGAIGTTGTTLGVLGYLKANATSRAAVKAQADTFATRRENSYDDCIAEEARKRDLRAALVRFGADPGELPPSAADGRPLFAPIPGGPGQAGTERACRAKAIRRVPDSNRPGGSR